MFFFSWTPSLAGKCGPGAAQVMQLLFLRLEGHFVHWGLTGLDDIWPFPSVICEEELSLMHNVGVCFSCQLFLEMHSAPVCVFYLIFQIFSWNLSFSSASHAFQTQDSSILGVSWCNFRNVTVLPPLVKILLKKLELPISLRDLCQSKRHYMTW